MRLSIAIVNWNTTALLKKCLESIRENGFECEVIVVDNASEDFDAETFAAKYPEVKIIRNTENAGYALGNNQANEASSGDYILLLNPDVELKFGALQALVEFMDAHPDAAATGCRLIKSDGRIERSCRGFPTPGAVAAEYLGLSRLFPRRFGGYRMTDFTYDHEVEVDQPMGSCLILSRKAVEQIGVFDTQFPIFFNEVDWCLRAKKCGWKVYFTPSAEVVHVGAASTSQAADKMRVESHRSLLRFYRKHYGRGIGYVFIALAAYMNMYLIRKPGKELRDYSEPDRTQESGELQPERARCITDASCPDVTVSIVNWNTREELAQCLESVVAQDGSVSYEVIVVDNESSDGSVEMVRERFPQVRLIENKRNLGFGTAHNMAIRLSGSRYMLLLNPDSVLQEPDALAKVVSYLDANRDIGILGLRVLNPDGSLQFSARRFPTIGAALFRHTIFGRLFPKNRFVRDYMMTDWDHSIPRDVDWVSGCAMALRRTTLERTGLLDERYYMYCEDVDICKSAWAAGAKVRYFPSATTVHRIGAASDQDPYRMIYQFHRSMFRFYLKHYSCRPNILLLPLVMIGLTVRAIGFSLKARK